jgi:hypothetical protein
VVTASPLKLFLLSVKPWRKAFLPLLKLPVLPTLSLPTQPAMDMIALSPATSATDRFLNL